MPLDISPELKAHGFLSTTTETTCVRILPLDGTRITLTSLDHSFDFEGDTYLPTSGYTPSAADTTPSLSVDNLEIVGILDDVSITTEDILAGRFDSAYVSIFIVNYKDLTQGKLSLIEGNAGNVMIKDNQYVMEVAGLTKGFQKNTCTVYTELCRVDLGDSECKVDLAPFTQTLTVTGLDGSEPNRIFDTDLTEADAYFDIGLVTWQTGLNAGYKMDVKQSFNANGQIELYEPMARDILPGDTALIVTGCDKRKETCRDRYSNMVNFRGYPHLPGLSRTLRGS